MNAKKQKSKSVFSGNHQRSWLWGQHAVLETLQAGRWPVLEIYASKEAYDQSSTLLNLKRQAGIPVDVVSNARLVELSKSTEHQGLVARVGVYPYQTTASFEGVLRHAVAEHAARPAKPPLVVICDRIQDAFNFGAILRCCDGAGVLGVIVGDRFQAEVTPHVARTSAGAVNYVPVVRTEDLVAAALRVKSIGFQLVAADGNSSSSAWASPLHSLSALIVGSEGFGIGPELRAICDQQLCIPMCGHVTSLNAAVATGILLYEIRRQQQAI